MGLAHQPVGTGQGQHGKPQADQIGGILLHPRRHHDHLAGDGRESCDQYQLDLHHMLPHVGREVLQHLQGNQDHEHLIQQANQALTGPVHTQIEQITAEKEQQLQR